MLGSLLPILEDHSVNRCFITIYLPQEVIKPENVFDRINKEESFLKYQRRNKMYSKVINIKKMNLRIELELIQKLESILEVVMS